MLAPGHDGEAELFIVFGCLLEVIDHDNYMIDSLKHES
jgi:hypothetical protein